MKNKDIFLVLCPLFQTKLPPLCLAYLAEFIESRGFSVDCHDLNIRLFRQSSDASKCEWNIQNNPKLQQFIASDVINIDNPIIYSLFEEIDIYKPRFISFSLFKSNYHPTIVLAQMIRKRWPDCRIIIGGPEIYSIVNKEDRVKIDEIKDIADFLVCGEGEQVLAEILSSGANIAKTRVCQLVFRPEELRSIHDFPFPRYGRLALTPYEKATVMPILASRGCVRRCAFCSESRLYPGYRVRSARSIVEEMQFHMARGVKQFVFYDSLINGDLGQLENMCDLLIENGLSIPWEAQCMIRSDMPAPLLRKMKDAGCFNLFIGLESGSDSVLTRMHKGFTTAQAKWFFEYLCAAGLHFEVSLIVNFPGETDEEFNETAAFIINNKRVIPKIAQVNPFVPYDGTDVNGLVHNDEQTGIDRMQRMVAMFEAEKIPYTRSYIGNLLAK